MTDQPAVVEVGAELELEVGPVAHGGHCVARHEGQVVFVRHSLPGERVRAVVTSRTSKFLRADAVEVLSPAPGRVAAPCQHARPGGCGGCDWQHADLADPAGAEGHGRGRAAQADGRPRARRRRRGGARGSRRARLAHPRAFHGRPGLRPARPPPAPLERGHPARPLPARASRRHRQRGARADLAGRPEHPGRLLADDRRRRRGRRRCGAGRSARPRALGRSRVAGGGRRLLAGAPGCGRTCSRQPCSRLWPLRRGSTPSTSTPAPGSTPPPWPRRSG